MLRTAGGISLRVTTLGMLRRTADAKGAAIFMATDRSIYSEARRMARGVVCAALHEPFRLRPGRKRMSAKRKTTIEALAEKYVAAGDPPRRACGPASTLG